MRIGNEENSLNVRKRDPADPYSYWIFEAVSSYKGRIFTALHEAVMVDTSKDVFNRLNDFSDLRQSQIKITLSEGGWLHLERDHRGYITLSYRLADSRSPAAMEGAVLIEGEYANAFCRELWALLKS
jgi:hypothetical protein